MTALPATDPLRQNLVAEVDYWYQRTISAERELSRERILGDRERMALSDRLQATMQQLYEARAEINRLNDLLEQREVV